MTDFESRVLNPADIEEEIEGVRRRIHNGIKVVSDARKAYNKARRAYRRALCTAYIRYEGPAHEKKYAAELATEDELEAMDHAEEAFKYALDLSEGLRDDLRALQSIGASIRSMYQTEGR